MQSVQLLLGSHIVGSRIIVGLRHQLHVKATSIASQSQAKWAKPWAKN